MRSARSWGTLGVALGWLLVAACGGTVITPDEDDSGGSAGTGSGGAGGSLPGGSGGTHIDGGSGGVPTGGSGGLPGGSGGVPTGGTGGTHIDGGSGGVPTGGVGGGWPGGSGGYPSDACPPMPSCNWCGGQTIYDSSGCPVGYVCANGVDPCVTQPCFEPWDCGSGASCIDMLCWPGVPACLSGTCNVGVNQDGTESSCDCRWSCQDGNDYSFSCTTTYNSTNCDCMINGISTFGCGSGSAGHGGAGGAPPVPDACGAGDCCGFPQ